MLTTANNKPISVGILEISSQNKAILEYFFANLGKKSFKEVSLEKASAFIIDYDSLGAKSSWEATFKETNKPGIIISIKEVELPSCIWLPKPLTVQALTEAGISIKEMILQTEKDTKDTEELFAAPIDKTPHVKEQKVDIETLPETAEEVFQFDELLTDTLSDQETKSSPKSKAVISNENPALILEENAEKQEPALMTAEVETTTPASKILPDNGKNETIKNSQSEDDKTLEIAGTDSDDNEIDVLLESLISGGKNNKKTDSKPSNLPKEKDSNTDITAKENEFDILLPLVEEPAKAKGNTIKENEISLDFDAPNELEDLQLKTVAKEETESTNDIDIIDFELEAAPTEKLENITSKIQDDGTSILLDEQNSNQKSINDIDEDSSFSPIKKETTVKENDEIDEMVAKILPPTKKSKQTKNTSEDELQSLLEEIRLEANDSKENIESANKPTDAEERWMLTCGSNKDTDNIKDLCVLTPSNHMIATLLETIEKSNWSKKVLRLKFKKIMIVIEPATDRIYCNHSIYSSEYANACFETLEKDKMKTHELDTSEIRLYRKKMQTEKDNTHTFEAFIWTTSLLTSRGRLPVGTDFNQNLELKYWPNLTRVENTPHMMQVAAMFHKQSSSLEKAPKDLGIPQKYVFAFYNAALSLDIIKSGASDNNSPSAENDEGMDKNKGFFSRLLKRISS